MGNNRLINKAALYFVGNLSSRFFSIFFIPLYAFFVATDELGYFDYYQTVMRIGMPIAFLAIWEAILKFVISKKDENNKQKVIATANTFVIFILILIAGITVAINSITKDRIDSLYLIATMIGLHALTQIWQYYARALSENKLYVIAGIVGSISYLFLSVVLIAIFKLGLNGLFLSYILSQAIIFLVIEYKIRLIKQYSLKDFRLLILLKMISFSAPLVLNLISIWLITGANRVIITNMLGADTNGLYSFASRFAIIVSMFGTIISMTLIEEAYIINDIKKYAASFSNIIQKLFKMYFSLIILAVPSIRLLYEVLKNSGYYQSANFVFILLLSALFSAIANNFGSAFQVTNKTQYIFVTTLIGAGISVGGALLSLNSLGIYGVLIAQLIGTISMAVSRAIFAYKFTGLKIKWDIVIVLFLYVVLLGLLSALNNIFLLIIVIVANIIIVYFTNNQDISRIYHYSLSYIKKTKN